MRRRATRGTTDELAAFEAQTDDLLGDIVQDVRVDLVGHR
jgi:hypothetical protein